MSHNRSRLDMLLIKPSWWARADAGPQDQTDTSLAGHPKRGHVVEESHPAPGTSATLPASPRPATERLTVVETAQVTRPAFPAPARPPAAR